MQAEKLLEANILDIIFDGKNKNYGAYNLRKNYNRRLEIAMMITFSGILLILIIAKLLTKTETNIQKKIFDVIDTRMAVISAPEKVLISTPKAGKTKSTEKAKSEIPVIVKNNLVKPIEKKLELISSGSEGLGEVRVNEIGSGLIGVNTGTNIISTVSDSVAGLNYSRLVKEEIEAEFPGGINSWRKYLEKYLDANIPIDNGAPGGTYTVIVSFMVNSLGEISDVRAETNWGFGMEKEAIKTIKKGPKWKAASQNGKPVSSIRKQPITFIVSEG